jgi:hypothetical protein
MNSAAGVAADGVPHSERRDVGGDVVDRKIARRRGGRQLTATVR